MISFYDFVTVQAYHIILWNRVWCII